MTDAIKSIRPFVGSQDFDLSRSFYRAFGFTEITIDGKMSYFHRAGFGFYLQNYYAKEWVDNTMVFLEVEDAAARLIEIQQLDLPGRFPGVRLSAMVQNDWGQEFFLHDPAGVLWHIGEFNN